MIGRSRPRRGVVAAAIIAMLGILVAVWPPTAAQADAAPDLFVGVRIRTSGELLISRFSSMLVTPTAEKTVTGLQAGDVIAGIDSSATSTTEVFAIASGGGTQRLYRININTGVATMVGAFTETLDALAGFDYNPVTQQLRVVLANGKNFRLDPGTGGVVDANPALEGVQPDAPLAYATGDVNAAQTVQVAAIANSNNVGGAGSTVTYGWDRSRGALVRIGDEDPPSSSNSGLVHTVVAGPTDWKSIITSFEVAPSGRAYVFAPGTDGVDGKLGRVDLTTGNITQVAGTTALPNYVGITTLQNPPSAEAAQFIGLTTNNGLLPFSAPSFTATGPIVSIQGTVAGDPILAIDFRGLDRKLYGLSGQGRLFTVDTATGATTLIGQHGQGTFGTVGFEWNPLTDKFRVIAPGSPTRNFRIDPATGTAVDADPQSEGVQPDQPVSFAAGDVNQGIVNPNLLDIAHSNAAAGGPTTIWGIEAFTGSLVRLGGHGGTSPSPESGQLFTARTLGQQPTSGGVDVASNGLGYAALTAPNGTVFLQLGGMDGDIGSAGPVVSTVGSMPTRLIGLSAVRTDSPPPPTTTTTTFTTTTSTSTPGTTTTTAPGTTTTSTPGPTTTTTALPAGQGDPVTRVAGADRIDTAIALSNAGYGPKAAGAIVLARADVFPDALTGTPLAVAKNAPLLLTNSDSLHADVEAEIKRALPAGGKVFLLGGDSALAPGVATKLEQLGFSVTRYSGDDRYGTALSVAINGLNSPATVLLATGLDFPDALAAGPAAAKASAAILLTAGDAMPLATKTYFDNHPGTKRYAIGLKAAAADSTATAVFGVDRYDTSRKVAEQFFAAPYAIVGLASGVAFPDGLSGGADIGRHGGPLMLAAPTFLPTVVSDYLVTRRQSINSGVAYGGPTALNQSVLDSLRTAIT